METVQTDDSVLFWLVFFYSALGKMGAIEMPLIGEIVRKSINILLFREDGYYVGAMWFVPFMATTTIIYAVLYLVFMKSNAKCFEPACIICGIMGAFWFPDMEQAKDIFIFQC